MSDKAIVGGDVSKGWLDLCVSGSEASERIDNTHDAIGAWLDRVGPGLVAFEPTGGYERSLIAAAAERGLPFVRVHPNDIVAFRKSRGIKAKTDRIDARLILAFVVDVLSRRGWRPLIRGDAALGALAARRRQLVAALHAERCRLALAAVGAVRTSLEAVIAVLHDSLEAVETELAAAIAANPDSAELSALLQTIFGIGPVVAGTLIADLPELGLLCGKQIAALVGLHTKESGKTRYRETTGHGRAGVRRAQGEEAFARVQRGAGRDPPSLPVQGVLRPARQPEPATRQGRARRRHAQTSGHR